jgi:hypothetical protein
MGLAARESLKYLHASARENEVEGLKVVVFSQLEPNVRQLFIMEKKYFLIPMIVAYAIGQLSNFIC